MNNENQNSQDQVKSLVGRYVIREGSISDHCCFEYSVLDTTKPCIIGGNHFEDRKGKHYYAVCECFDKESAVLICNLLNAPNAQITGPKAPVH